MPINKNGEYSVPGGKLKRTVRQLEHLFVGKEEKINGIWYPVKVYAYSVSDANKKLRKGMRKSYGTVQDVRGRWTKA